MRKVTANPAIFTIFAFNLAILGGSASNVHAQIPGPTPASPPPTALPQSTLPISPDDIAKSIPQVVPVDELIDQLDSPRFSQRKQAVRRLESRGAEAHQALESAIKTRGAETADRCLEILSRAYHSEDEKTSASAAESLQRIAQGNGVHAKAAANLLSPPADPRDKQMGRRGFGQWPQMIPPGIGGAPGLGGGANRRTSISVRTINGVREIMVEENGLRYEFKDVDGGLEVSRPDGKGGLKTKTFRDAKELKEKDPEAHQKYERAVGSGNGIQIRMGAGLGRMGRMQIPGFGIPQDLDDLFQQPPFGMQSPLQPNPVPNPAPAPNGNPRLKLFPLEKAPAPLQPQKKGRDKSKRIEV